jgi:hypothetical protein
VKRVIVVLAFLLTACGSQASTSPTVADLTSHHYVSTRYVGANLDGFATYRTPLGGRSDVRLQFNFSQRVVRIEFVSHDNWFDHHAGARLYLPISGYKPECQPDPILKVIDCEFGFPGGSTGVYLYGTALDAGTFHYAVRLREQIAGTKHWTGTAYGRDLVVEWDETVMA